MFFIHICSLATKTTKQNKMQWKRHLKYFIGLFLQKCLKSALNESLKTRRNFFYFNVQREDVSSIYTPLKSPFSTFQRRSDKNECKNRFRRSVYICGTRKWSDWIWIYVEFEKVIKSLILWKHSLTAQKIAENTPKLFQFPPKRTRLINQWTKRRTHKKQNTWRLVNFIIFEMPFL